MRASSTTCDAPLATGRDDVTWGEMVEARFWPSCDVTVQRLRPAIVELRQEFGRYPLAQARPFLDGACRGDTVDRGAPAR